MNKYLILLFSVSMPVLAQSNMFPEVDKNSEGCQLNQVPLTKQVALDTSVPEYFFKPVPSKNKKDKRDDVSLIVEGGNYIMDMNTGKRNRIPGPYDGVPTPDGEFIVSPALGSHIQFFDRDGLGPDSKPVYDDAESGNRLNGVYHSMGVLNKTEFENGRREVTYRAITDTVTTSDDAGNGLMYKDYTFEIDGSKKRMVKESGAPRLLCGNFAKKTIKTPILSKDGKMLSAYNEESGTTMIYSIETHTDGSSICKVKKDLGFATSKMEFSPDGKRVVFAMNSLPSSPSTVGWYAQPPIDSHNMNVFVYDMESDDLTKISSVAKGNAYYPSFSNDGQEVVWMAQDLEPGTKYSVKYSVKRAAVKDAPAIQGKHLTKIKGCNLDDPSVMNMMAIGKLWESVCSQISNTGTMSFLATLPLSLDKKNCSELVKGYWQKYKAQSNPDDVKLVMDSGEEGKGLSSEDRKFYVDKFLSLDETKLLETCEGFKGKNKDSAAAVVSVDGGAKKTNVVDSCMQCHSNPNSPRFIPFDKPELLGKWKKKMQLHVVTGNMPKNMKLSVEEREDILDYLEKIKD